MELKDKKANAWLMRKQIEVLTMQLRGLEQEIIQEMNISTMKKEVKHEKEMVSE